MKRLLTTIMISILLMISASIKAQVSTWDGTWEPWTHGTGTEADPFLIENAQQLAYLAYQVNNGLDAGGGHVSNHNSHYKLMTDVNLNGSEDFQWTPIGYWNSDTDYQYFGGHFDGNGYIIAGLYINSTSYRVGFWGHTEQATIENITINGEKIRNCNSSSNVSLTFAGGIVGFADNTVINNCENNCNVTADNDFCYSNNPYSYAGGIVGYCQNNAMILHCKNSGIVRALSDFGGSFHSYSGGISGYGGVVYSCCNTGDVSAWCGDSMGSVTSISGGIIGGGGTVTNSYNTGNIVSNCISPDISASSYCGGVIGEGGWVTNCYNCGDIKSSGYVVYNDNYLASAGGIIGGYGTAEYSYNVGTILDGWTYSGGITGFNGTAMNSYYLDSCGGDDQYGGVPMSSYEMKTEALVAILNYLSCNAFVQDVTPNINDGYPLLTMMTDCAYTGNASDWTDVSATLHGSVCANYINFTKGFEYRKVGESEYTTVNVDDENSYYAYNLSGLEPNNTYEYRAFAYFPDCDYIAYGDIRTFFVTWLNNDIININNAEMLRWVSEQCNNGATFEGKVLKILNDIEFPANQPNNFTAIGTYPDYPFKGVFDGNGYTIANISMDQTNSHYQGLFGYTQNAEIYDLRVENPNITGRNYCGGLVGYAENTGIRDCCVTDGLLHALNYCGGLVGYQEQGDNSKISGCYNTSGVYGSNYIGGLIGYSNSSTVRNSYVAGLVSGQGNAVGGIIGGAHEVLMYSSYYNIDITNRNAAIGENYFKEGEGKTTSQMRSSQFVATMNQGLSPSIWMADIFPNINNGFPILHWQAENHFGVDENDAISNHLILYPNPANELVTIKLDDVECNISQIRVFDVSGREVLSANASGQEHNLNVSGLLKGIYFIRVITEEDGVANLKLVVE